MVLSVNDFTFEERDFENLLLLVSYNKATEYIKRLVPTAKKKMLHISNKTPRNVPCPCGSGRKYKNCCGK